MEAMQTKLVWRIEDVKTAVGISSTTTVMKYVKELGFPQPKKVGYHLAWVPSEVEAWVAEQMARPFKKAYSPKLGH